MARKNTINFTKKNLDNLPIPKGDERPSYYDEQVNGLLVRVTNKGTRSYMVFRRINGKPKKTTLGIYPNMTIEQARSEAIKILGLISEGINPNSIKEGQLTKQTLTLEKVFKDYRRSRGTNLEESTIPRIYIQTLKVRGTPCHYRLHTYNTSLTHQTKFA